MKITLNGVPHPVDEGTTLAALIASRAGSTRGSAVVVDGEVVPRSSWAAHTLAEGQQVELLTAVQGG